MLCEAAGTDRLAAVRVMGDPGFDLNRRGTRTPLLVAAFNGHLEVVRDLVTAGADTTLRDPSYHTPPLVHAMHSQQAGVVACLMEQPMDIFTAAARDRADHVLAALERAPDCLNARFRFVRSGTGEVHVNNRAPPLWFAAVNGRDAMVGLLLESGADPTVRDGEGHSLAEHARAAGQAAIAEKIEASVAAGQACDPAGLGLAGRGCTGRLLCFATPPGGQAIGQSGTG